MDADVFVVYIVWYSEVKKKKKNEKKKTNEGEKVKT